jgi:hypothetical protein
MSDHEETVEELEAAAFAIKPDRFGTPRKFDIKEAQCFRKRYTAADQAAALTMLGLYLPPAAIWGALDLAKARRLLKDLRPLKKQRDAVIAALEKITSGNWSRSAAAKGRKLHELKSKLDMKYFRALYALRSLDKSIPRARGNTTEGES